MLCFKVKVSTNQRSLFSEARFAYVILSLHIFSSVSQSCWALRGKICLWLAERNISRLFFLKSILSGVFSSRVQLHCCCLNMCCHMILASKQFWTLVKFLVLSKPKTFFFLNSVWYLNGNYLVILVSAAIILPLALMKQLGEWIQDGRYILYECGYILFYRNSFLPGLVLRCIDSGLKARISVCLCPRVGTLQRNNQLQLSRSHSLLYAVNNFYFQNRSFIPKAVACWCFQ